MTKTSESIIKDIDTIERRLKEIEIEKAVLENELDRLKKEHKVSIVAVSEKFIKTPIPPDDKITLFISLFACRSDVYPGFWENKRKGTKGYSPVCTNEWIPEICKKPKFKCLECSNRAFSSFSRDVVKSHLEGRIVA